MVWKAPASRLKMRICPNCWRKRSVIFMQKFPAYEPEAMEEEEDLSIPADPEIRNFSYTLVDGKLYFRENSRMHRHAAADHREPRARDGRPARLCAAAYPLSVRELSRRPDKGGAGKAEQAVRRLCEKNTTACIPAATIWRSAMIPAIACCVHWRCWMMRAISSARRICSPSVPSSPP